MNTSDFHSNEVEPVEFADVLWDLGWFFVTQLAVLLSLVRTSRPVAVEVRQLSSSTTAATTSSTSMQPQLGRKALSYYGMPITKGTKPLLINTLAEWLSKDELTGEMNIQGVPPILRDELGTFVVKPNGTTAADTDTRRPCSGRGYCLLCGSYIHPEPDAQTL